MYIIRYTVRIDEEATLHDTEFLLARMDGLTGGFHDGEAVKQSDCRTAGEVKDFVDDLKNIKAKHPKHWMASDGVTVGGIKVFRQQTLKEMEEMERE